MWMLIIIAMNINNPNDQPGKVMIEFPTLQECERALSSMKWELKFKNFKVEGVCKKQ